MLSQIFFLTVLLAFFDRAISAQNNFTLYAYGKGVKSGLKLFYGDAQAYVGYRAPSFVSQSVNITLSQTEEGAQLVATPERTMDWASAPTMYIDVTNGVKNPVGFVNDGETLPEGSTAFGFGLFGGWVYHKTEESPIEMKFVATPTNETDIYLVRWNAPGTKSSDDISIALRTMAPISDDENDSA